MYLVPRNKNHKLKLHFPYKRGPLWRIRNLFLTNKKDYTSNYFCQIIASVYLYYELWTTCKWLYFLKNYRYRASIAGKWIEVTRIFSFKNHSVRILRKPVQSFQIYHWIPLKFLLILWWSKVFWWRLISTEYAAE